MLTASKIASIGFIISYTLQIEYETFFTILFCDISSLLFASCTHNYNQQVIILIVMYALPQLHNLFGLFITVVVDNHIRPQVITDPRSPFDATYCVPIQLNYSLHLHPLSLIFVFYKF